MSFPSASYPLSQLDKLFPPVTTKVCRWVARNLCLVSVALFAVAGLQAVESEGGDPVAVHKAAGNEVAASRKAIGKLVNEGVSTDPALSARLAGFQKKNARLKEAISVWNKTIATHHEVIEVREKAVEMDRELAAPVFNPKSTLPPLTRYGWATPLDISKVFADHWGYTIGYEGYFLEKRLKDLKDPESDLARIIKLMQAADGLGTS